MSDCMDCSNSLLVCKCANIFVVLITATGMLHCMQVLWFSSFVKMEFT